MRKGRLESSLEVKGKDKTTGHVTMELLRAQLVRCKLEKTLALDSTCLASCAHGAQESELRISPELEQLLAVRLLDTLLM